MTEPDPLASFGPFFEARTHDRPLQLPWLAMGALVVDGSSLAARMSQVGAALAASAPTVGTGAPAVQIEARVVASVTQLGIVSRLTAPVVGLAVLGDPDPIVDLADVYWQAEVGGPFPLSLPRELVPGGLLPDGRRPPLVTAGETPLQAFLEGPVHALVEAMMARVPVAPHVLWGNVASTIHASAEMVRAARPELAPRVSGITDAALAHPLLRTAHERQDGRFRRRSCCLIYRIAAPTRPRTLCVDCVLEP